MRNVDTSTSNQPKAKPPQSTPRIVGSVTFQTMPPSGCHQAKSAINARLDNST